MTRADIGGGSSGNVFYYFADHLGTSRTIVQAGQTSPCYDADFYPYGGERVVTNTCSQKYKFTGKERDMESGLDNFGARFDSSWMGRFMSPDWSEKPQTVPYADFSDPQTLNLYAYGHNNPLRWTDPDGHCVFGLDTIVCVYAAGVAIGSYLIYKGLSDLDKSSSIGVELGKERAKESQEMYEAGARGDETDKRQDAVLDKTKKTLAQAGDAGIKATQVVGTHSAGDIPANIADVVGGVISTVVNGAAIKSAEKLTQNQSDKVDSTSKQQEQCREHDHLVGDCSR